MDLPEQYLEIQEQFNRVINWSQGFNPSTKTLFGDWYNNKKRFIDWFGGKLIHEIGEVEFHIDKGKREVMINDFLDQCGHVMKFDEYGNFYQFVKANQETFFNNLVSNTVLTFNKPITKGMKLSKAFKFFIEDKEMLVQIQQLASSYIQKDKIHGKMCLSVHPLDYLSASENNYNWRSCHALDGEYRAGNLSYMTDSTTICCYIKGDKEEVLPDFPSDILWNSKKWRMWIHISDDSKCCFLGRQYPFTLDGIPERIHDLLPGSDWDNFTNIHISHVTDNQEITYDLSSSYIVLKGEFYEHELYKEKDVIEEGGVLNYNDLLRSSFYKPFYTSRGRFQKCYDEKPKIIVGHRVKCLCCGKNSIDVGEGLMICNRCGEDLGLLSYGITCSCCGESYDEDDITYLNDGTPICNECLQDNYCYCENCGEWFRDDEVIWSEKYQECFCRDCFDEIAEEEVRYCKEHHLYDEN